MAYGRLIEYEGQQGEAFRREVTYPVAAQQAAWWRAAALVRRRATPTATQLPDLLRRLAAG